MKLAAAATSDLADALFVDGIEISPSQVGRILKGMNIDVTGVRGPRTAPLVPLPR